MKLRPENSPSFSAGEKVRIKDGFAELEVIFLAGDGNDRVILLLNFLHRQQQVNTPFRDNKSVNIPP